MVNPDVPWLAQNIPDICYSDLRSDPRERCWKYLGVSPEPAASEFHTDESLVLSVLMNFNTDATQSHWKPKKKKKGKKIHIAGI